MKLLTKTTLYFITITLFVFLAGGAVLYVLMQNLVRNEVNTELIQRFHFVYNQLNQKDTLTQKNFITSELINIEQINPQEKPNLIQYKDTILYSPVTNSYSPYRQLSAVIKLKSRYYRIRIYKSLISSNVLIEKVATITTLMLMLFLLLAYFLNRYIFKQVWFDFFDTLHKIQEFSLAQPKKEAFTSSEIIEFHELNKLLNKMTDKIINDYEGMKEFTGNLSHEVQTPLAVIKNKTELLLQEPLTEKQYELVGSVYSAANRLSAIVRSLALIARIDKNQFTETNPIHLDKIILNHIENYQSLLDSRNIKLETNFKGNPNILMNTELAEILTNNLIKNAVKHNIENGFIKIMLTNDTLIISNSGEDPGISTEKLFDQFSRASDEGFMGIGLSIVRKIVEHYQMSINYSYNDKTHIITVLFHQ